MLILTFVRAKTRIMRTEHQDTSSAQIWKRVSWCNPFLSCKMFTSFSPSWSALAAGDIRIHIRSHQKKKKEEEKAALKDTCYTHSETKTQKDRNQNVGWKDIETVTHLTCNVFILDKVHTRTPQRELLVNSWLLIIKRRRLIKTTHSGAAALLCERLEEQIVLNRGSSTKSVLNEIKELLW